MMVLILIMCVVAVYYFVKTYKREMREKEERLAKKRAENAVKQTANDDQ
ncbi:MAG: hypothetical protein HS105_06080 [Chloracidobacterium sp.]|nr:hypothetical protein [Chloracidobacterium sp.]